ncbi:PTS sugar transporter subunit IIC [Amedibacillus sp. YH-ame10]
MKTLQDKLQKWLFPIAMKLEKQKHLQSVKDGVIAIIPIIIIGSFCMIPIGIGNMIGGGVGDWVNAHIDIFNFPTYFTTNIMSLFSAFFIADSLAKRYDMKSSLIGVSAVLVQLILCVGLGEGGWDVSSLGAEGLFVSIIGSIFVVEVTRLMAKYHLVLKMPDSVPSMVAESFSILFPLAVNVIVASTVAMCCTEFGGTAFPKIIISLLAPAISSMDSVWAVALIVLLTQLLWVFGLHGAAITSSVWAPFAISYATQNAAMTAAGQAPEHIFTFGFYYGFLQVSGSGLTLLLVIMMMRSKAKSLSSIGKIGIVPSIFGINEPIIFGVPMIMNPFMFIPFVFGPVIVSIITYLCMQYGLVSLPLWEAPGFLPPGFQAFLLTLDWRAAALAIFSVCLMGVFYYPFFKAMEADELRKEREIEAENAEAQKLAETQN